MILDESVENLRGSKINEDKKDSSLYTGETRTLGLIVVRGNLIQTISSEDGFEEISNPYL